MNKKKGTITRTTGTASINPDKTRGGQTRTYNTVRHLKKKTKTHKDTYLNRLRFKISDKLTTRRNKKVEEKRKKDKTGKKKYRKKFYVNKYSKTGHSNQAGPFNENIGMGDQV